MCGCMTLEERTKMKKPAKINTKIFRTKFKREPMNDYWMQHMVALLGATYAIVHDKTVIDGLGGMNRSLEE